MAELILTDEEKAAVSWLELSDETVGKLTKKIAAGLPGLAKEQEKLWWTAAAFILIGAADDSNSDKQETVINGFCRDNDKRGDWRIIIERVSQ